MVVIKRELSDQLERLEVFAIADNHWADPHSNHKRIMEDIAYIRDNPHVYCILNGDLMNCAIKSAVSDIYAETLSPMEELRVCVELFGPIKDKILCVVPGNHEMRHYRTNGIDITRLMCQQLGIEDRYSPSTAVLFLRFGRDAGYDRHHRKMLYTLYVTHGSGGGAKDGGKIQKLTDLAHIIDVDIYIAGHHHLGASLKKGFHRVNPSNGSVTNGQHLFVNTCAALDYGGYAEISAFDPPCLDRPIIYLSGTKKEMRCAV